MPSVQGTLSNILTRRCDISEEENKTRKFILFISSIKKRDEGSFVTEYLLFTEHCGGVSGPPASSGWNAERFSHLLESSCQQWGTFSLLGSAR